MNEQAEKWEKSGLLEGLDEFNKNECANSLENLVEILLGRKKEYMLAVDKVYGKGFFAGVIIPIVRCLYETEESAAKAPFVSLEWLIEDFAGHCIKNRQLFLALNSYISLDGEAEFVRMYADKLKKEL